MNSGRREAPRLPAVVTSFVGRASELDELRRMLGTRWLISLIGPAGVGKSRLALRAAEQARRAFGERVYLADLASTCEPTEVARAVAVAVGVSSDHEPLPPRLAEHLHGKKSLLVLDNCEHIVDACVELIGHLITAAPELRILVTTRHVLGVAGEFVLQVAPMSVPHVNDFRTARSLDVMELFASRAAAVACGFTVNEDNWITVLGLCRRLDGLPLAIELAITWLSTLSLEEIASRLDDRFRLLRRRGNAVAGRHHALAAAIGWSYEICSDTERLLWSRATVFVGGFSLDAAEAVCTDGLLDRGQVLVTIAALLEKSVLWRDRTTSHTRYAMLEMTYEYGLRAPHHKSHLHQLRRAHLRHYLSLAEDIERRWHSGVRQAALCTVLREDYQNFCAALRFALSTHQHHKDGLRLAGALFPLWIHCGHIEDGRRFLNSALSLNSELGPELAKALWVMAYATSLRGDLADGKRLAEQSRRAAEQIGDHDSLGYALFVHAGNAFLAGAHALASELYAHAVTHGGNANFVAVTAAARSLAKAMQGKADQALALGEQMLALSAHGDDESCARVYAHCALAISYWQLHDHGAAAEHVAVGLTMARALNEVLATSLLVETSCWLTSRSGRHERAAELHGVARVLWRTVGGSPMMGSPILLALRDDNLRRIQEALCGEVFRAASRRADCTALRLDEVAQLAVGQHEQPVAGRAIDAERAPLTKREWQVADLVARGMSDRSIAERLGITCRTAERHMCNILGKLGFSSRAELAVWVVAVPST